jgi:DNA-binding NarL/FixJ family response regulator
VEKNFPYFCKCFLHPPRSHLTEGVYHQEKDKPVTKKIAVGILDDHPAVIAGYEALFGDSKDLEVKWTARFYESVWPNLEKYPTDVLILDASVDISPENPNTFPILHEIPALLETYPEMAILVISMHARPAFIKAIRKTGASGYILKDDVESNENLPDIVLAVAGGEIYYSPEAEKMISEPTIEKTKLTKRQIEILSVCASSPNMTTHELAEKLDLAPSTMRNHLSEIYFRLGVRKMASAIVEARQLGLITPDVEGI